MAKTKILLSLLCLLAQWYDLPGQDLSKAQNRKILEEFQSTIPYHLAFSETILEASSTTLILDGHNWRENLALIENQLNLNHRIVNDQLILYPKKKFLLRGFVVDQESGESLPGAHILNDQNALGTISDVAGHFQLYLSEGPANIHLSYLGYHTKTLNLDMQNDQEINVSLSPSVDLPQVVVTNQITNSNISDVKQDEENHILPYPNFLPSLGTSMDISRQLQLTAGIITGGDGFGGLHVRGGNADQNLILLEDIPIFNAFHLFGVSSIFNGDVIQKVKLSKNYFSPSLEGRLSSALEVTIRDGHRSKPHLSISTGPFSSQAVLETPILKKKGTIMLAGQRSHLGRLVRDYSTRYRGDADNDGYFKPLFYDLYGKVFYKLGQRDKLILNFYHGADKHLDINQYAFDDGYDTTYLDQYQDEYQWGNTVGGIKWLHQFSGSIFLKLNFYHSRYQYQSRNAYVEQIVSGNTNHAGINELTEFRSTVRENGIRANLSWLLGFTHQLEAGFRLTNNNYTPGIIAYGENAVDIEKIKIGEPLPQLPETLFDALTFKSHHFSLFLEDQWTPSGPWNLQYGLNAGIFSSDGKKFASLQPRLNLRYRFQKHQFGLTFNKLFQNQHSITANDNGLPSDLWVPSTRNFEPEKSWSSDLSWTYTPNQTVQLTSRIYYKKLTGLLSFRDNPGYLNFGSLDNIDASIWESDVVSGYGTGWGFENSAKIIWKNILVDLNYTFSKSSRFFKGKYLDFIVPYEFEVPHNINISCYRKFSDHWSAGCTWQINSGSRYNLLPGKYELYDNTDFFLEDLVVDQGNIDLIIMPVYHRLDLSVAYIFRAIGKSQHELKLSLLNAYGRNNIIFPRIYRDEISDIRFTQGLPFIPSISYHISIQ
ncbi:MAG: TonB-dependent receptor [Saprospiraceae bacterium]|nr:TonB-dependent receptor [Saprospiraceae bacterium]